jgi:hypothetical protein
MEMRKRAEKLQGEAVRRSQFGRSNEALTTARAENSWQHGPLFFCFVLGLGRTKRRVKSNTS